MYEQGSGEQDTLSSAPYHFFVDDHLFLKGVLVLGRPGMPGNALASAFCLGRGFTFTNKGWPLAEPRSHSPLPPVWQHDTKAVWLVYTFQAEPLFRGGCSLRVMGPLQTKPASFLIKSK